MRFIELRRTIYKYHTTKFPYLNHFWKNPYTWLKARFYMEGGSVLTYLLLRTKITPNAVTVAYGISGILAGVLLAVPNTMVRVVAVIIFFTRGILDWTDGNLARAKKQTSVVGVYLDEYGGLLGSLGIQIGLGLYVAQQSGLTFVYFLVPFIPLFYAIRFDWFVYRTILREGLPSGIVKEDILRDLKRQKDDTITALDRRIEDAGYDLERFNESMDERKLTVQALIDSVDESLNRFNNLGEKK